MASIIKTLIPLRERYSQNELHQALDGFRLILQITTLEDFVEGLDSEDVQHLENVQARLTAQDALHRAAVPINQDCIKLMLEFLDVLFKTRIELLEKRAEWIGGAIQFKLDNKYKADNSVFNYILEMSNLDFLELFRKELIINKNYMHNINQLIRLHQEDLNAIEEFIAPIRRIALLDPQQIHEQLNIRGPIAPQDRAVQPPRAAAAKPATRTTINTHAVTIHDDASESALRLQKDFPARSFQPKMADIRWIFANPKHKQELLDLVCSELEEGEEKPSANKLQESVMAALNKALKNDAFKDPKSGISLSEITKTLLVGINSIGDAETQKAAFLQLCKALYLLQNEYAYLANMRHDTASCDPGLFNGLIYSQASTLPKHVHIRMQSKAHATIALGDKMQRFALDMLKENSYTDADAFATAVMQQSKRQAPQIMQAIVADYYAVFGYNNPQEASNEPHKLDRHCRTLCGCRVADLFDMLPINFQEMFNDFKQAVRVSRPSPLRS